MKKSTQKKIWSAIGISLWAIITLPVNMVRDIVTFLDWIVRSLVKGTMYLFKKTTNNKHHKVEHQREGVGAIYQPFKVMHTYAGSFKEYEQFISSDKSKIGIILGARGTGKTAIGMKILENIYAKSKRKLYAMGFRAEDMPDWIEVIESVEEISNNSTILIDEGGVLFSSRNAMTKPNKLLSQLILIARHKNLNILFISQNSSNLDVNILRQADHLILKPTALLQKDFERRKIRDTYEEIKDDFKKYEKQHGATYIYSEIFRGFVANPLPSFWNTNISKSFR